MNSVLFAKMDQVFSKENKTLKKYWKFGKNTGKVREFCQSGKVGTLGWRDDMWGWGRTKTNFKPVRKFHSKFLLSLNLRQPYLNSC